MDSQCIQDRITLKLSCSYLLVKHGRSSVLARACIVAFKTDSIISITQCCSSNMNSEAYKKYVVCQTYEEMHPI